MSKPYIKKADRREFFKFFSEERLAKYEPLRMKNAMLQKAQRNFERLSYIGEIRTLNVYEGLRYYVLDDICASLGVLKADGLAVCKRPMTVQFLEGAKGCRIRERVCIKADDVRNVYEVALGQGRVDEVNGLEYVLHVFRRRYKEKLYV